MVDHELHLNLQYLYSKASSLKKWFRGWLFRKLPVRVKRMMFLASLFAYLIGKKTPTDQSIRRLNVALKLYNDHDAIKFPILIYKSLWKSLDDNINFYSAIGETFTQYAKRLTMAGRSREIGEVVFRHSPYWMLYGDRETIVKDIETMILNVF